MASLNSVIANASESPTRLPAESPGNSSMGPTCVCVEPELRDRLFISHDVFLCGLLKLTDSGNDPVI